MRANNGLFCLCCFPTGLQAVEKIKEEVGIEHPDKSVIIEWLLCDLSSFCSVKDFVTAFRGKDLPLNLLINNAGVAWLPFSECYIEMSAKYKMHNLAIPFTLTYKHNYNY